MRAREAIAAILERAGQPVDGASIVVFRIAFGLLLAHRLWGELRDGVFHALYLEPSYLFTYPGFEWVRPWPAEGLSVHVILTAACALAVATGTFYRASALLFGVGYAYLFLLDQTRYLNHDYLIVLYAVLLACVPAHRQMSVDARLRPSIASSTVPRGALWALRAQMAIVYFYAGVAKLNADWLTGWPMRIWLSRSDLPLVGDLLANEQVAVAMSWSGMAIDLLAAPLLLVRRTRVAMFVVLLAFHFLNAQLFSIGVFPWLSIAVTTLFFAPEWPRRFLRWPEATPGAPSRSRVWTALGLLYFAVQIALPLRHHLYPGDVAWTEEGHRFSWRMLLRHKEGDAVFFVRDPATGSIWTYDPARLLTPDQLDELPGHPPMIHQLAREIARRHRAELGIDVEVRARVRCSLNGRTPRLVVDPSIDLAHAPERVLTPDPWILR